MHNLKPLLAGLAVTGAIAGGGAAIASAASSTPSTSGAAGATGTATTAPSRTTPPSQGNHAPGSQGGNGSHHCPNM